jgi:FeS assembly SUF system regulator
MLKLSKKSDYGLIAVKHLATCGLQAAQSASEIAEEYHISAPLMAKVLQKLAKGGLVTAQHGSTGGYRLARHPDEITALDVINAIDGPVFITSCVTQKGKCDQATTCTVREPLRRVNESIMQVLGTVTISQMSEGPEQPALVQMHS